MEHAEVTQVAGRYARYQQREAEWRSLIPHRLMATGCYLCAALDETNTMRFLPTYLCKCAPRTGSSPSPSAGAG